MHFFRIFTRFIKHTQKKTVDTPIRFTYMIV